MLFKHQEGKRVARVLLTTLDFRKDKTILCVHQHLKFLAIKRNHSNDTQPKTRNFSQASMYKKNSEKTNKAQSQNIASNLNLSIIITSTLHSSYFTCCHLHRNNSHSNARSSRRKVSSYPSG